MTERMPQVDELVKQEIAKIILRLFPEEFITVTQVHVTKDLSFAKVWISSFKNVESSVKKCESKAKEIRQVLAGRISLRKVPSLHFVPDQTEEKAENIDRLLDKIKKEQNVD